VNFPKLLYRQILNCKTCSGQLDSKRRLLLRQEGFSYKEIAQVVNVAPTSVGTLLARALERFASVYTKENLGNGTPG